MLQAFAYIEQCEFKDQLQCGVMVLIHVLRTVERVHMYYTQGSLIILEKMKFKNEFHSKGPFWCCPCHDKDLEPMHTIKDISLFIIIREC